MNNSAERNPLNKKRFRNLSFGEVDKSIDSTKKYKSAETQKVLNKNIAFMAYINTDYKNENIIYEKLKGDDLIIDCRKVKAIEIINTAKANNNKEINEIKKSLKYDNTNKYTIYKLLQYYKNINDQNKFNEAIRLYKFCITQKFTIKEENEEIFVDLNKLFEIKEPIEELEELDDCKMEENKEKDIRNSLVSIFTCYYYISSYMAKYERILKENDLNEIISIKYETEPNNNFSCVLLFEEDKKRKILSHYETIYKSITKDDIDLLLLKINNFFYRYLFMKDFTYFQLNQPISFEHNLTLYYNYIIYSIYEITLYVEESQNKIIFKLPQLNIYNSLKNYHDLLFDKFFDEAVPINKTIDFLLQFLLLLLSAQEEHNWSNKFEKLIHPQKTDTFLTCSLINTILKYLYESCCGITATVDDDKIRLFYENDTVQDKIEIKIENLSTKIFNFKTINWIWEGLKFEELQNSNFFTEKDIKYLKYLIQQILSSKLFEDIFRNFSDILSVSDYYFKDSKNIEDYINRIIFLPFKRKDINKFAITDRRILSILVSGLPENKINNLEKYRINRILELSVRVIILADHEPSHFIKAAYSLIKEGKISRYTSNTDNNIDSGFYLEEVPFGWIVDKDNPLDLSKLLSEEIECKNEAILNKRIDLITALQLLNPDIYKKDLAYFRKEIFKVSKKDLKKFKISSNDLVYKEYIESMIDIKKINNIDVKKHDYSINASMSSESGYYVQYTPTNHNI